MRTMKKLVVVLLSILFLIAAFGCDKNEMKLQTESEHFIFYAYDEDKSCLNDLESALESNYDRITNDLQVTLDHKITIDIYPDLDMFHSAIGEPEAEEWLVGVYMNGTIKMVSPLHPGNQHSYESLMKVIVHEFTHVLVSELSLSSHDIPIWLNEGVAVYEAEQFSNDAETLIRDLIKHDTIPTLDDLDNSNFGELHGYQLSYTAVEYIVVECGYASLIALIKNPSDMQSILGMDMTQFETAWKNYLTKHYMGT